MGIFSYVVLLPDTIFSISFITSSIEGNLSFLGGPLLNPLQTIEESSILVLESFAIDTSNEPRRLVPFGLSTSFRFLFGRRFSISVNKSFARLLNTDQLRQCSI